MDEYPHIPQSGGQYFREIQHAHVFDKLDGNGCRSEWSRKAGWYKHGKRHSTALDDGSTPWLTVVPSMFEATLAEPLERIARKNRWQHLVVYYEFWGVQSLAGMHVEGDPKFLTVFDAAPEKRDILGPIEFRRCFEGEVLTPAYLGLAHWTRGYIERVRLGEIEGVTFEGVVGKAAEGKRLVMAKAKTQAWKDRVRSVHGENAEKIINS